MSIFFDSDFEGGSFAADGWTDFNDGVPAAMSISTEVGGLTGTHAVRGHFDNINGSSLQPSLNHTFTPTANLFIRYGYRQSSGFQVGSNNFTKTVRLLMEGSYPIFLIECYGAGGSFSYEVTVEDPWGRCPGTYNFIANVQPSQTSWDQVELEIQPNTAGNADGAIRMWINNTPITLQAILGTATLGVTATAVQLFGPTPSSVCNGEAHPSTFQFDSVKLFIQSGLGNEYFDRFAVGNARIGLIGGADTTPPAAPTGVTVT